MAGRHHKTIKSDPINALEWRLSELGFSSEWDTDYVLEAIEEFERYMLGGTELHVNNIDLYTLCCIFYENFRLKKIELQEANRQLKELRKYKLIKDLENGANKKTK